MDANEIMEVNDDVMDVAVDSIGNNGGIKIAVGCGIGFAAGVLVCKVIIPLIGKVKAKKLDDDEWYDETVNIEDEKES